MPWCDECSRFQPATSVGEAGECPACGHVISAATSEAGAPWHFKLLVVATVLYLAWRAVQGLAWLANRL